MSQLDSMRPASEQNRASSSPASNVYTVLAMVAMGGLLFGIVFLWIRSSMVFGTSHPWELLG